MAATFTISRRVWESMTDGERDIMRHLAPRHGVGMVRAFLRSLRRFGGTWSHGFTARKDGELFAWSGPDSDRWHTLGEERPTSEAEALARFPVPQQHNLNSTATREERSAYIAAVLNWWNTYGSPDHQAKSIADAYNPRAMDRLAADVAAS